MNKPRVFVTRIIPERGLAKVLAHTDATVWQEELPPPAPCCWIGRARPTAC